MKRLSGYFQANKCVGGTSPLFHRGIKNNPRIALTQSSLDFTGDISSKAKIVFIFFLSHLSTRKPLKLTEEGSSWKVLKLNRGKSRISLRKW
jgi:hypothetical protein